MNNNFRIRIDDSEVKDWLNKAAKEIPDDLESAVRTVTANGLKKARAETKQGTGKRHKHQKPPKSARTSWKEREYKDNAQRKAFRAQIYSKDVAVFILEKGRQPGVAKNTSGVKRVNGQNVFAKPRKVGAIAPTHYLEKNVYPSIQKDFEQRIDNVLAKAVK